MSNSIITHRQLQGLMGMLVVEFILGVTLTTLISYDPDKQSTMQLGFLVAHIVIGIGLLGGSTARLVIAFRDHSLQKSSLIGFVSIIGAFAAGVAATKTGDDLSVFLMALLFLSAFGAYGYSLGQLRAEHESISLPNGKHQ